MLWPATPAPSPPRWRLARVGSRPLGSEWFTWREALYALLGGRHAPLDRRSLQGCARRRPAAEPLGPRASPGHLAAPGRVVDAADGGRRAGRAVAHRASYQVPVVSVPSAETFSEYERPIFQANGSSRQVQPMPSPSKEAQFVPSAASAPQMEKRAILPVLGCDPACRPT